MAGRGTKIRKAGKVLVINSDPEIINILEINLAHANLEIVTARSGSEALRKIQEDKTDIIILDPALPDMEGAEIYRKITGSHLTNHIPIILLSARLPRKNRIAKAEDIPIYHITKPFNPKEVVALVQGYLMHKERMVRINPLTGLPNRLQISKEMGIPYYEIPIRTSKNRLGKYALMGFLERLEEEMEDIIEDEKLKAEGKGKETYRSEM